MQLSYTDANALHHSRGGKTGAPAGQTILKSKWKVSEHTNDAKKYRAASIDNHEITLQFYKFSKLSCKIQVVILRALSAFFWMPLIVAAIPEAAVETVDTSAVVCSTTAATEVLSALISSAAAATVLARPETSSARPETRWTLRRI